MFTSEKNLFKVHTMFSRSLRQAAKILPPVCQRRLKIWNASRRDAAVTKLIRSIGGTSTLEEVSCALCGGHSVALHTKQNGFRIVQCKRDGLLFVSPRPVELAPYYDDRYFTRTSPDAYVQGGYGDYTEFAGKYLQPEWQARLDHIEVMRRKGCLLDVGCATGLFLEAARQRGFAIAGVEMSAWAAAQARERTGAVIFEGGLPDPRVTASTFDVVTMWDCIEHLSNPVATLADAHRVLKRDGLLILSTGVVPHRDPYVMSHWYFPPWHLYYFSDETMQAMLEKCGFKILSVTHQNDNVPEHRIMLVTAQVTA